VWRKWPPSAFHDDSWKFTEGLLRHVHDDRLHALAIGGELKVAVLVEHDLGLSATPDGSSTSHGIPEGAALSPLRQ
jgi:hypothetical protein